MSFEQQLQKRMDYDGRVMEEAFDDLAAVLGIEKKPGQAKAKDEEAQRALEAIFTALSLKVPKVPNEITDLQARLEYMCRQSGVMTRRVELGGTWWTKTQGPLLGSLKTGEAAAILPGRFSGYTFLMQSLAGKSRWTARPRPGWMEMPSSFIRLCPPRN